MAEHGTSPPPPRRQQQQQRTSARLHPALLRILLVALTAPGCANPWWSASPPAEATSVSTPQPEPSTPSTHAGGGAHPPGHMKPLGSHAPPEGEAPSLAAPRPSPPSFFRHFVSPGRPVLLRGAASRMPAYRLWRDDAYLARRYGSLQVTVELGRKENRSAGVYGGSLASFLRSFARHDVYAVWSLPAAMRPEVWPPACLACGGLERSLVDSVLWLSGGGTSSVLHYDSPDNVICVLAGRKRFFMADRAELARLGLERGDGGAFLGVDVDRVDMYRYPGLRSMRWYSATVDAGDCLFVPYKWLHQVNSDAGRSMAVNFWFVHLRWFNQSDCEEKEKKKKEKTPPPYEGVPLSDYRMASTLELLRSQVLEDFEGRDVVTPGEVKEWLRGRGHTNASGILARLFQASDGDGDGALSMEELYTAPAEMFATLLGVTGDAKTEDEHGSSPLHQASHPPHAQQQARASDEL